MTAPSGVERRSRSRRAEHGIPISTGLLVLAVVAAIAGAVSGAEPVGNRAIDALWCAGFSSVLVLAASRSRRLPTAVLGGVSGVVGIGGDPAGVVLGVLSLAGTGYLAFTRSRERLLGGLVGLLAGQALLHGPSYGFVGLPTLVAAAVVVPVLVSAWRISRSRERKIARRSALVLAALVLVGAATAAVAALESRPHLDNAAEGAENGLDLLRAGESVVAADEFSAAQFDFERASSTLDGPLGYLGRLVPGVAQQLDALRQVSDAGQELGFTAAQAASSADWGALDASSGAVNLFQVEAMQEPVAASSAAIDDALATVDEVRSPWLLWLLDDELDSLQGRLGDAADEASIAAEGLAVAPALFGADGPRRYLVAFATPGESRNGGGFIGAFATITATDGRLAIERTGSAMEELRLDDEVELDLPDEWDRLYNSYEVDRFPGNMSASPDWPTDAAVGAQVYAASPDGAPVDGVIYADPAALAALLLITGPIEVEGVPEPLTPMNAEQYLLIDQYVEYQGREANAERREILGDVARAVFDALISRPIPDLRTLADTLGPAVEGGHLRIATLAGDDERAFLRRVGIDGAFAPDPTSDFLSLRSSNLVPSKIDAYLSREVSVDVSIDPESGDVATTVRALLRNDAPSGGIPDYVIGTGTVVPRGTNRDLLSLYSPLGLTGATVDGNPVGVQSQRELDTNVYAVPVDIPPGGQVEIVYTLEGPPPASLVDEGVYRLVVLPQALARPDVLAVQVTAGEGRAVQIPATPTEAPVKIDLRVVDTSR